MPQLYLIKIYINVPDNILYKRYNDLCLFVEFFNKKNPLTGMTIAWCGLKNDLSP